MGKSNVGILNKYGKLKKREKEVLITLSIIGIIVFGLYIFTEPQYKYKHIKDIKYLDVGRKIITCGHIENIEKKGDTTFFTLKEGNSSIRVVYFKYSTNKIKENEIVCIKGEAKVYKGQKELISHEISHEVV